MAGITSLETIAKFLQGVITPPTPLPPISKEQIRLGMPLRPGLSANKIWSEIATNKSKAGIPAVPSEEDLAMEMIRVKAIVNALLKDAKIEIVIPENAINVTVYVPGAPPTPIGIGVNDRPILGIVKGVGIIR